MAKLYPPYIESKLPAQSGTELRIPFRLNRAVSKSDIQHVIARIKTVSTSQWKGTVPAIDDELVKQIEQQNFGYLYDSVNDQYTAIINLNNYNLGLNIGQYYKIQLAFYNQISGLGYYSTVGIFKYTQQPVVYIEGLQENGKNANQYSYVGVYSQQLRDESEKIYSYRFDIRDTFTGELIDTSGECIHNASTDEKGYESKDEFALTYELADGKNYSIQYSVTTMNGLIANSPSYVIQRTDVIPIGLKGTLIAENDYDNGCIEIRLKNSDVNSPAKTNRGFIISRSSSKDNYQSWYDIITITVAAQSVVPELLGTDFTTEQGISYRYGLQQYQNSGMRTQRMETAEPVVADFEDSFLYDGTRQFKLRFNTQVNTFKSTLLETKMDTIGGKYPFIFRNANVQYKEFPISALVSYLSDNDQLFMSDSELGIAPYDVGRDTTPTVLDYSRVRVRSTQVDTTNLLAERNFKLKALDWLNNGQPKLFRSPGEGNYIVRLLNVSLAPNNTVGRMLHTMSATAYEVADYNYSNLVKYHFTSEVTYDNKTMVYITKRLKGMDEGTINFYAQGGAYYAVFRQVPYGTLIRLNFLNGQGDQDIMIGNTGTYEVNIFDYPLMQVTFLSTRTAHGLDGLFDYGVYTVDEVEDFSQVRNVVFSDIVYQHYGYASDIVASLTDIKMKPGYIYYLRLETRQTRDIYYKSGKYYVDERCTDELKKFTSSVIYHVWQGDVVNGDYYLDGNNPGIRGFNPSYKYTMAVNGDKKMLYDLEGPGSIIVTNLDSLDYLATDNGLIVDLVYQNREYIYGVEEDNEIVKSAKNNWELAKNQLLSLRGDESADPTDVRIAETAERNAYSAFLATLAPYVT